MGPGLLGVIREIIPGKPDKQGRIDQEGDRQRPGVQPAAQHPHPQPRQQDHRNPQAVHPVHVGVDGEALEQARRELDQQEGGGADLPEGQPLPRLPDGPGQPRQGQDQEQPDSGTITLGETVKLASVDQFRDSMDNSKTVWEEVSGGLDIMKIGNTEIPSRAYVGRFNFKGVDQGKRVGELSGGERGRLHLAKLLQVGGNMLLLDEPTNDLDIETLRALENALLEFPGCAMVISHDRWFLDRIATHILDYQDEGKVEFFEGNFTEYEEYKKRTLGADALEPKRIKYKRIAK